MSQSEALLEAQLVTQLRGMGYGPVVIEDDASLLALQRICEEEHLDQKQFANLIESYIFSGQEPLKDDVFKCLEARPSVLKAREIGERIGERMKEYVEVFVRGMVA